MGAMGPGSGRPGGRTWRGGIHGGVECGVAVRAVAAPVPSAAAVLLAERVTDGYWLPVWRAEPDAAPSVTPPVCVRSRVAAGLPDRRDRGWPERDGPREKGGPQREQGRRGEHQTPQSAEKQPAPCPPSSCGAAEQAGTSQSCNHAFLPPNDAAARSKSTRHSNKHSSGQCHRSIVLTSSGAASLPLYIFAFPRNSTLDDSEFPH
jgi:hypothetical protein